jgi:hypothetical protein
MYFDIEDHIESNFKRMDDWRSGTMLKQTLEAESWKEYMASK